MKGALTWVKNASWFSLGISVAVTLLFGAIMVQGATTISTNISTEGTLGVTGLSTLTAGFVSQASSTVVGAQTVTGAVWASSTLQATGASRFYADSIFDGGIDAVTLTHSNSATSSITVGCVDTFATSTASPIKFMLFATSSTVLNSVTVATDFGGGTMQGLVLWGFGACS